MLIADSHPTSMSVIRYYASLYHLLTADYLVSVPWSLATVMRQVWDCVCTDPLHQHIREAESLWGGCENTFMSELNEYELELYHLFDGSMEYLRSPFRICRDLAFYDEGKTDIGEILPRLS